MLAMESRGQGLRETSGRSNISRGCRNEYIYQGEEESHIPRLWVSKHAVDEARDVILPLHRKVPRVRLCNGRAALVHTWTFGTGRVD